MGKTHIATPPRASRKRVCVAATAEHALARDDAATATPGPRSRETSPQTTLSIPAAAAPSPSLPPDQASTLQYPVARLFPGIAAQIRHRSTASQCRRDLQPQSPAHCHRPRRMDAAPNGVSTHTRQSPSSSRHRSITIVRSSGTSVVAIS